MKRFVILAVVALGIGAFFALGLGQYLSLEYLQASRGARGGTGERGAGHRIDRVLRWFMWWLLGCRCRAPPS